MKTRWIMLSMITLGVLLVGMAFAVPALAQPALTDQEQLGKDLYFDPTLSDPAGQACAACHAPQVGFTGPDSMTNATTGVYEGAVAGRYGNRKPPAAAYAGFSGNLRYEDGLWVGGTFWDGRATGLSLALHDPLAEQAQGPFLNPLEMNMANAAAVVNAAKASTYKDLFNQVCNVAGDEYNCIGRAIAAYERSFEVTAFTSKFDAFWVKAQAKGLDVTAIDQKNWNKYMKLGLEADELKGLAIFNTTGKCSGCHLLEAGPAGYPLFTDYTYDNLGIPRNPLNPFYKEPAFNPEGYNWVDPGLGGYLRSTGEPSAVYMAEMGKFKVPTLRNVALRPDNKLVKAYGHNGYFKSLPEIVHFYNTRDVAPWPLPEYAPTVNMTELGSLGLTAREEEYLVAFMKTLSDGWKK